MVCGLFVLNGVEGSRTHNVELRSTHKVDGDPL